VVLDFGSQENPKDFLCRKLNKFSCILKTLNKHRVFLILFDLLFVGLLFYGYNTHLKEYSFLGKLKLIAEAKVQILVGALILRIKKHHLSDILSRRINFVIFYDKLNGTCSFSKKR